MLKRRGWRRYRSNGYIGPRCAGFDGSVFDLAHGPQQRWFALVRRDFAVGLEQLSEVADQVGIGEQARPVRSFGRRFRGFAHASGSLMDVWSDPRDAHAGVQPCDAPQPHEFT